MMASLKRCRVYWIQNEGFPSDSSSVDDVPDPLVIDEKLKSAFSKIVSSDFNGVLQFWAPVETGEGPILTTCDQVYAHKHTNSNDHRYERYRRLSQFYKYNIDVVNKFKGKQDNRITDDGAPATAFLNHLPELALDLNDYEICPKLRYIIKGCELTSFFMLPVFYPCGRSCVGVVECCMDNAADFLSLFKEVNQALQSVGLSTFSVQECLSSKTIPGLECAIHEIEVALDIVCESHDLAIAQVWIPYEKENHVTLLSSLEGNATKQMLAVKLTGFCADLDDDEDEDVLSPIKNYYDTCDMLPLKMGDGLVRKVLQTYEPHFCRNMYELHMKIHKNQLLKLSPLTKFSCLVICLRSIDTGDTDYVFEFLWSQNRNHSILLESLLLTLKSCLPSFKFAAGEQLGEELHIVDVENSTGSGSGFFKIHEGNKISPMHQALEGRRLMADDSILSSNVESKTTPIPLPQERIRQQFGRPMNEAVKNLTRCQQPNFVKRNSSDVYVSQSNSNDDNSNQDIFIIKVELSDDVFIINIPVSLATLSVIKKEINMRCKLNSSTYKLKYLDEDDEWILVTSDEHVRNRIGCQRTVNGSHMQLRVLPLTK